VAQEEPRRHGDQRKEEGKEFSVGFGGYTHANGARRGGIVMKFILDLSTYSSEGCIIPWISSVADMTMS
jgi:hypothetical protein